MLDNVDSASRIRRPAFGASSISNCRVVLRFTAQNERVKGGEALRKSAGRITEGPGPDVFCPISRKRDLGTEFSKIPMRGRLGLGALASSDPNLRRRAYVYTASQLSCSYDPISRAFLLFVFGRCWHCM
jgi:hypothetical protein